jgi:ABC-type polysaccharide/polyol phosphate transport system ATPase subunit
VLVSHSAELVRSLCTIAVWIEHGSTQMCGPVDAVLAAYDAAQPHMS